MKLYKLSLLALALAGTMVACSDDDDYTAANATPGAFFPVNSPEVVELPVDANSVDLLIRRNSDIPMDQTFNLTVTDPSGLFNIPKSVTFIGHEVTAQLHVTYDSNKIVMDQEYPVEIKIDGMANSWGITDYKFSFGRNTPMEITDLGVGVYIYTTYLEGSGGYEIEKQVNALNPNIETYIVKNWYDYPEEDDGIDLKLILHKDEILPNGYPYVEMDFTEITYRNPNYDGPIMIVGYLEFCEWRYGLTFEEIRDNYHYNLVSTTGATILDPSMISYYDAETGTFHLFDQSCVFPDGEYAGYFAQDWEYLYLPGFPDYDLDLSYMGYFTSENDEITAYGNLYAGSDVETVEIYNVAADSEEDALEQVANGSVEGVEVDFTAGDYTNVSVAVPGAGDYVMVAVAYAEGEVMNYAFASYTISGANAATGTWESIGTGIYTDGWVLPAYSISGVQVNPFDFSYYVEIEQNLDVDGEYRMVSPYTSDGFALASQNVNTKKTNIVFNIADPDWPTVPFQASGFSDGYMEWISDYNWFAENVFGVSKDQVLNSQNAANASFYTGGVLEVILPLFAMDASKEFSSDIDDLGSYWGGGYPSELVFPEATQAATAAKAIRHAVSNDSFVRNVKAIRNKVDVKKEAPRKQKPQLKSNLQFQQAEVSYLR